MRCAVFNQLKKRHGINYSDRFYIRLLMPCLLCYKGLLHTYKQASPSVIHRIRIDFRYEGNSRSAIFTILSPYFFIDLSGRKYPEWMFAKYTNVANSRRVIEINSLFRYTVLSFSRSSKPGKTRVLQGWDVTIWSNPGSTAIISIILLSIYSSWSVSDSTRNLPILFTSLFIDIIFALHYGFIFHLSDAVFTAIVPSA